ncbi:MAG: thiamine-phosphate kinase [Pseudoclavibacter sp.]|nr:thiamine-phosphate kinase [Pseudoclavibacter sp.]
MRASVETVGSLGERALLERILALLPPAGPETLGAGDDAAVLPLPDGRAVVTNDLMVEGPDFLRHWSSPEETGRKAAVSNLADLAAMGARPVALVAGLVLPTATPVVWPCGFARGLAAALAEFAPECRVVGGDLSTGPVLAVSITAIGDLGGAAPVRRDGARPGDVLALAGFAGRSAAGLELLRARVREPARAAVGPDGLPSRDGVARLRAADPGTAACVDQHLAPRAPVDAGPAAGRAGASAMMDVSDGLLLDAGRLARSSGLVLDLEPAGLACDVEALAGPLARGLPELTDGERERLARRLVFGGGEDHALLAAFPPTAPLPEPFRRIGAARACAAGEAPGVLVAGASPDELGWDPYAPTGSGPR